MCVCVCVCVWLKETNANNGEEMSRRVINDCQYAKPWSASPEISEDFAPPSSATPADGRAVLPVLGGEESSCCRCALQAPEMAKCLDVFLFAFINLPSSQEERARGGKVLEKKKRKPFCV